MDTSRDQTFNTSSQGLTRDLTAPRDSGYTEGKSFAQRIADKGLGERIMDGAYDSAIAVGTATRGLRARTRYNGEDDQLDEKFVSGLADLVKAQYPHATDSELELLLDSRNAREYYTMAAAIDGVHENAKEADASGVAKTARFTGDIAPELLIGLKGSGMIAKMASGGKRLATGGVAGAAIAGGSEYGRQYLRTDETDPSTVLLNTAIGAVLGVALDGVASSEWAGVLSRGKNKLADAAAGAKATGQSVDDVAAAAKAADGEVSPAAASVVDDKDAMRRLLEGAATPPAKAPRYDKVEFQKALRQQATKARREAAAEKAARAAKEPAIDKTALDNVLDNSSVKSAASAGDKADMQRLLDAASAKKAKRAKAAVEDKEVLSAELKDASVANRKAATQRFLDKMRGKTEAALAETARLKAAAREHMLETSGSAEARSFHQAQAEAEDAYWDVMQRDAMLSAAGAKPALVGQMEQAFMDARAATAAKAEKAAAPVSAPAPVVRTVADDVSPAPVVKAEGGRVSTLDAEALEARIPEGALQGRLRIKVGGQHYKPRFESQVDRALASVALGTDREAALSVLRQAFPGHTDEVLESMGNTYFHSMLTPHLTHSATGAPAVARYWNRLDPELHMPRAKLIETTVAPVALREFIDNAPVTAEAIAKHADDADGAMLSGAVDTANKWVTKRTVASGFAWLVKNPRTSRLGQDMVTRIELFLAKHGVAPDLNLVRTWMAKEIYGRKLHDLRVGAKVEDIAEEAAVAQADEVVEAVVKADAPVVEPVEAPVVKAEAEPVVAPVEAPAVDDPALAFVKETSLRKGFKNLMSISSAGMKDVEKATMLEAQQRAIRAAMRETNGELVNMSLSDARALIAKHLENTDAAAVRASVEDSAAVQKKLTAESRGAARAADEGEDVVSDMGTASLSRQRGFAAVTQLSFIAAGAVVVTVLLSEDANAAGGAAGAASGVAQGAAAVGALIGGKYLSKLLLTKGILAPKTVDKVVQARKAINAGKDPAAVESVYGVGVRNGELTLVVKNVKDLPKLLDPAISSKKLDKVVDAIQAQTVEGLPVKGLLSYSMETDVKALGTLGEDSIKPLVVGKGKKAITVSLHNTPFASVMADASRVAMDPSKMMRGLSQLVMTSPIGRASGKAMEMAADALYKSAHTRNLGSMQLSFNKHLPDYLKEQGMKMPSFIRVSERNALYAKFAKDIADAKEFGAGEGISAVARKVADDIAKLEAESIGRAKQLVKYMEERGMVLADDSPLKRAAELDADPHYLSRVLDSKKFNEILSQVGDAGMKRLIKEGMLKASTKVAPEKLDDVVDTVFKTLSTASDDMGIFVTRAVAEGVEDKMRLAGYAEEDIAIIASMFGVRNNPKTPAVLKRRRLELDSSASITHTLADGSTVDIRLADIYNRDIRQLFGRWSHSMSGLEAMGTAGSRHGIDMTNDAWFADALRAAKADGADDYSIEAMKAYRDLMMGYRKDPNIFGSPGATERAIRGAGTYWLGSNFVLAQLGDIGGLGSKGLRHVFKGFKGATQLRAALKDGKITEGELHYLAELMDIGMDQVSATTANFVENGHEMAALITDTLQHTQSKLNGMHFVANGAALTRGIEIQHHVVRYILGEQVDPKMWKHYAASGIDEALALELQAVVRRNPAVMKFDADKVFKGFDKQLLMKEDFELFRRYQMGLQKAGNTANAIASGIGEGAQFMRSQMAGRFIGQLMSTAMFITQRSRGELQRFDSVVMQAWATSMMFSAGSYMVRTALRYPNDKEELEKRLTYEQIFLAAVRNSSFAGIAPNAIDMALNYSGIKPGGFFAYSTTRGTSAGELAIQGAIKTPMGALAGIMGLFKSGDAYTQGDAYALQRSLLPFWFLAPVMAVATKELPSKNPKQPAEEPAASPFN